jgi:hypothetical protein
MKTDQCFRLSFILVLIILWLPASRAQVEDIGTLLAAGAEDAELLLEPYLSPYINAFGASLAGGWYNTAETHKLGGFDVTFTTNFAMVSDDYVTFDLDGIELQSLRPDDPDLTLTPTVAGNNEPGPQMNYNLPGYTVKAFDMPQGTDWRYVPAPMITAGVGLIKGTEVLGRFMPNVKLGDSKLGLWGIGGKHDIKQWIPGLKKLPVLQLSVMYGYTKLHTNLGINVDPSDIGAEDLPVDPAYEGDWDNQELQFTAQSHTANLLVSANLPVVCFYGGLGFITTKTNLAMKGDYPFVNIGTGSPFTGPYVGALVDPIDMEIKNQDGGITKPRFNIGIRFKLSVITIHFDYTRANFNVATAGLGFTFR